ncbi:MAG: class I SAM-dependent methyltransferase [Pseudobdellovibrionaceae bacterium]
MKLDIKADLPLPQALQDQIHLVRDQLQLTETQTPKDNYFIYDEKGLSLKDEELGLLHLDFINDTTNYSRTAHRGKSELIAKAVGLAKGHKRVFDATLGLAQDAWFLTQLGAEVEGCERSPVVYLLLFDALQRSGELRLKIHYGDSIEKLQNLQNISTVFLDPMFPDKKKSALPRKEMRIFRKWVGDDMDAQALLQMALRSTAERVVVKRPIKAPDLQSGVVHSFEGKTVRYDLYSPAAGR